MALSDTKQLLQIGTASTYEDSFQERKSAKNITKTFMTTSDGTRILEDSLVMTLPTNAQTYNNGLINLEFLVKENRTKEFMEVVKNLKIDMISAETIIQLIDYSLSLGLALLARKLSEQGAILYPNSDELQKYQRVLASPKVIRKDLPPNPQAALNVQWLKENGTKYQGQWVAIKEGVLLAAADSVGELMTKTDYQKNSKILVTRV